MLFGVCITLSSSLTIDFLDFLSLMACFIVAELIEAFTVSDRDGIDFLNPDCTAFAFGKRLKATEARA